jgi:hypothetical protein
MPGLGGNASAACGAAKVVPFPTGQIGHWSLRFSTSALSDLPDPTTLLCRRQGYELS